MIKRYRKKPVVIEALEWDGENLSDLSTFIEETNAISVSSKGEVIIGTLEGDMMASKGDFIIKGVAGEFYPCKPDIFAATYEEVVVKFVGDTPPDPMENMGRT